MHPYNGARLPLMTALIAAMAACTLPGYGSAVDSGATMIAATVAVLQTGVAGTQTAKVTEVPPTLEATASAVPTPLPIFTPLATVEPKPPVVTALALCWTGPGPAYPVVSSVKVGTAVDVLGVGSQTGWFVIQNPTYHNRCWIEAKNLQLDPNFSVAGLQVYNPPPTPGPKRRPRRYRRRHDESHNCNLLSSCRVPGMHTCWRAHRGDRQRCPGICHGAGPVDALARGYLSAHYAQSLGAHGFTGIRSFRGYDLGRQCFAAQQSRLPLFAPCGPGARDITSGNRKIAGRGVAACASH